MASLLEVEVIQLLGIWRVLVASFANWSLYIAAVWRADYAYFWRAKLHCWNESRIRLRESLENLLHSSGLQLWFPRWWIESVLHPEVHIEHYCGVLVRYFQFLCCWFIMAESVFCWQLFEQIKYHSGYVCKVVLDPRRPLPQEIGIYFQVFDFLLLNRPFQESYHL